MAQFLQNPNDSFEECVGYFYPDLTSPIVFVFLYSLSLKKEMTRIRYFAVVCD